MVITTRSFPCNHDYRYVEEVYIDNKPYELYRCFKCDDIKYVPAPY